MASSPLIRPAEFGAIATFCAEEVGRQYANHNDSMVAAQAVGWMIDAWLYAISLRYRPITVAMIEEWGRRVEPLANANGFRKFKIQVGNHEGMNPWHIPSAMVYFVEKRLPELAHDPDLAYHDFEVIHPFGDGNGRTGKILFNYMRKKLKAPTMPYDYWGVSNP